MKSAILLAGLSAEGPTVVREAVTTRAHTEEMLAEAGVDLAVEPWGEGRVVTLRPSAAAAGDASVSCRAIPRPRPSSWWPAAWCPGSRV